MNQKAIKNKMNNNKIEQELVFLRNAIQGKFGNDLDLSGLVSQEVINIFTNQLKQENNMQNTTTIFKDRYDNEVCVGDILEIDLSYSNGDALLVEEENGEIFFKSNLNNERLSNIDLKAMNAAVVGNKFYSPNLPELYKF